MNTIAANLKVNRPCWIIAKSLPDDGMIVTVNRPAMAYGPGDVRMMKIFKAINDGKFMMIGSGETLAHLGYVDDQTDSFLLGAVKPATMSTLQPLILPQAHTLPSTSWRSTSPRPVTVSNYPKSKFRYRTGMVCRAYYVKSSASHLVSNRQYSVAVSVFLPTIRSFDLSKAKRLLNYNPQMEAEQGIKMTLDWYKQQGLI